MQRRSPSVSTSTRGVTLAVTGALVVALHLSISVAAVQEAPLGTTDDALIVHVLHRLGFGPRPGQVEAVRRIGVDTWIAQQLQPDRLADEAVAPRLAPLTTLTMPTAALIARFYAPAYELRRKVQQASGENGAAPVEPPTPGAEMEMSTREGMRGQREAARAVLTPDEFSTLDEARRGVRKVTSDLTSQKILRAAYSERQLQEVLVDFWFNHFNVFAGKPQVQPYVTAYERDAIRPHVFGSFRDLLGAVAKSPAMLVYLDNWQSAAPPGATTLAEATRGQRPRPRGLNENYARELLELHTLGVDGGYTQTDIVEVARAFTGWTVRAPRQGGDFLFNPRMHDAGAKAVLGATIPAGGGQADGERVLDLLARHPSTARFIATKLAQRLVADDPPPALVGRAATAYRDTDGDLREVVRVIVMSPELRAPDVRRVKLKSPFEFVISALRATDAEVSDTRTLAQQLRTLGMPLYFAQPPTGYTEQSAQWATTGTLLSRMNFAVALTANRLPGVRLPADRMNDPAAAALELGSPAFQRR